MEFASFVPDAVRRHASDVLQHYASVLVGYEAEVSKIDAAIAEQIHHGRAAPLDYLRRKKNEAADRLAGLRRDIDTITRLVTDDRMGEAYKFLAEALCDAEDGERERAESGYIYAAWSASIDFAPYREALLQAADLPRQIADAANKLSYLLRKAMKIGVHCPPEFFSISDLLRQTDNHDLDGHDPHMWRAMRPAVLGDLPSEELVAVQIADEGTGEPSEVELEVVPPPASASESSSANERRRASLRYGWGVAPSLPDVLETVASAASCWTPAEGGFIGAALDSRKRNHKTEYLRALADILTDVHHLELTKGVMKAMVATTTVVLDDADLVVTYDDVRKVVLSIEQRKQRGRA